MRILLAPSSAVSADLSTDTVGDVVVLHSGDDCVSEGVERQSVAFRYILGTSNVQSAAIGSELLGQFVRAVSFALIEVAFEQICIVVEVIEKRQ